MDYETLVDVIDTELGHPPSTLPTEPAAPHDGAGIPTSTLHEPAGMTKAPLPAIPLDRLPAPEAVLEIPRAEIERALADRVQLEERLETTAGTFSGRRLLKLRDVGSGNLYERFGLQRDDVLMFVDDQWITDESNPLWRALETGDEITLLVMRNGRPHRYRYRIR